MDINGRKYKSYDFIVKYDLIHLLCQKQFSPKTEIPFDFNALINLI